MNRSLYVSHTVLTVRTSKWQKGRFTIGITNTLSGLLKFIFGGQPLPTLGVISMDSCIVDLSEVKNISGNTFCFSGTLSMAMGMQVSIVCERNIGLWKISTAVWKKVS